MINKERLLKTFTDYIAIDSESGSEAAMGKRLLSDLKAIGGDAYTDGAGNVIAKFPGKGDPLLFVAHMDTMPPGKGIRPIIENGLIHTDGTTILAGDDKSGVAAIMEAIITAKEKNIPCRAVEVAFTTGEETGMNGAKALDFAKISAREAIVFDSGGDVGKIITAAPGQKKIRAEIKGKAAHAGVAPETGISAIEVGAHAIARMKLLRIDEETTANIGTFKGEGPTNVVCPSAYIEAEVRSRNTDKLNAQADDMLECLKKACSDFGAELNAQTTTSYLGYTHKEDDPLIKLIAAAVRKIGLTPSAAPSGGGSDANIFNTEGIKAVLTSTGMDKVHTTEECLTVKNLEDTAALVLELMKA